MMILDLTSLLDCFWLLIPLLGFVWAPKTWTPGELVTAASMNTNIRDHLNEGLRTQTLSLTTVSVTSSSVANPSVITTGAAHGLVSGNKVLIAGHSGSTPDINGEHVATVLTTTTFSIPVNVTVGGTGGTVAAVELDDFGLDGPFAYLKCTNTNAFVLTGALIDSGNIDGARVIVEAIDKNVTLKHQNAGSATANRFICEFGADIILAVEERALLVYDTPNTRWRAGKISLDSRLLLGVGFSSGAENVDAAETDLTGYGFTIPANFLRDGESIELWGRALLAANGDTKTLTFYLDGTNSGEVYSGAENAHVLQFSMKITRRSSTLAAMHGIAAVFPNAGGAVATHIGVNRSIASVDFTIDQTSKLTGQGSATGDIKMTEYNARALRGNGKIV